MGQSEAVVPEIEAATRIWLFGAWQVLDTTMPPYYLMDLGTLLAKSPAPSGLLLREQIVIRPSQHLARSIREDLYKRW